MALVQYSDSEDTDPEPQPPKKKLRKDNASEKLPPLPAAFRDLYATNTRVSVHDDPSLHGGRKRVIPHVEGNWPTHIYLEWIPGRGELKMLEGILSKCNSRLEDQKLRMHSLLYSDLGVQLPLHISLSRPVVLRTEQKESFLELLRHRVTNSGIQRFNVVPNSLYWVSNYERTRWFLVLRVARPENNALNRLLRISNESLAVYGQPPLYASPTAQRENGEKSEKHTSQPTKEEQDYSECFHISLAWSLTEPSAEDKTRTMGIDLGPVGQTEISFDCVKAKIGNVVSSLPLK